MMKMTILQWWHGDDHDGKCKDDDCKDDNGNDYGDGDDSEALFRLIGRETPNIKF